MVEQASLAGRAAHGAPSGRPTRAGPARTRVRILAIGADLRRMRVLRAFLDGLGPYECTAMGSAGPGLNALVGRPWAVAVVVDDLPSVGAEQVIATASSLGSQVPLVAVTLRFDPHRSQTLYRAGAAEVVSVDDGLLDALGPAVARTVERRALLDHVAALESDAADRQPVDATTGLFPPWRFDEEVALEVARARRRGGEVSLLGLDVKTVPPLDRWSPAEQVGVLRRVASLVRTTLRNGDVAAHDGGGCFRLLLIDTGPLSAADRCDAVERTIRAGFDQAGLSALVATTSLSLTDADRASLIPASRVTGAS